MTNNNDKGVVPVAWVCPATGQCYTETVVRTDGIDTTNWKPLYSAVTVEALLARVAELEERMARVLRWCDGVRNHPNISYNPELYETATKVRDLAGAAQ